MLRAFAVAVVALALVVGGLLAEEIKGRLKSVDADKSTLTVTVDGKEREFKITDDTKILNPKGGEVKQRLRAKAFQNPGANLIIKTDKKDGKEVVVEVKLAGKKAP